MSCDSFANAIRFRIPWAKRPSVVGLTLLELSMLLPMLTAPFWTIMHPHLAVPPSTFPPKRTIELPGREIGNNPVLPPTSCPACDIRLQPAGKSMASCAVLARERRDDLVSTHNGRRAGIRRIDNRGIGNRGIDKPRIFRGRTFRLGDDRLSEAGRVLP